MPALANDDFGLHDDDVIMDEAVDKAIFRSTIMSSQDDADYGTLLRMFYQRFFPYKMYFNWLNYDTLPNKNFFNREFSFTLASDVYLRYNSFADAEEFRREIERLQPVKIDIGAIYTAKPKDKKQLRPQAFQPVEKELVFDIDMTDYDEIRTCCSGGAICLKCWEFMTIAVKVLDEALRQDFGFKHLLWVYSGRRGVHCWVSDETARKLSNDSRKAIVTYLEVVKGGAQASKKVRLNQLLHPSLSRALDVLKDYFPQLILEKQHVLAEPETWNKLLELISDQVIRQALDERWQADPTRSAQAKWKDIKQQLLASNYNEARAETVMREIIFQYTYPRLDDNVSVHINHLLKSPFCVHPKTNRVCVPIDPQTCDSFNPLEVPTLARLHQELNDYNSPYGSGKSLSDIEKTSLAPYIKIFDTFVNELLKEVRDQKRGKSYGVLK